MSQNYWNPAQYNLFEKERNQPFYDLLDLILPVEGISAVDLGCGTGALTQVLHRTLNASHTLGIDSSPEMLRESSKYQDPSLHFALTDVQDFKPEEPVDLIFSNACLQWLPDHVSLFTRLSTYLSTRGQWAIQMPANYDYPSHTLARELAQEPYFLSAGAIPLQPTLLLPEQYAELFYRLGFAQQSVRLQVYPLVLDSPEALLQWVKGSLLTYYESCLSPPHYQEFLNEYRKRLLKHFHGQSPLFVPFKRLLLWGCRSFEA